MTQIVSRPWGVVFTLILLIAGCGDTPPMMDPDAGNSGICQTALACDDGVFCNGAETCAPDNAAADENGCVQAASPCTRGVGGMTGVCDERLDVCELECPDADGDGQRDVACGGDDCDDGDAMRFPGNTEVCDAVGHDEDCNPCTIGERDVDADTFVDAVCANAFMAGDSPTCGATVRVDDVLLRVVGFDCDDNDDGVKPGQAETCNSRDDDCDAQMDEDLDYVSYWPDQDSDSAGDMTATPTSACIQPMGFVGNDDDCLDSDPEVRPGRAEVCDDKDNDCDITVDELDAPNIYFQDLDMDGFGDSAVSMSALSCTPPAGFVADPGDCDESDSSIHPGADDPCDRIDQTCSLVADPGGVEASEDADTDGHAPVNASCDDTLSGSFPADDCDDTRADRHPMAGEFCSGADEDCDTRVDEGTTSQCGADATCSNGCVTERSLDLGSDAACAVTAQGAVACWGVSNVTPDTVFGTPGPRTQATPMPVPGVGGVTQIALGRQHACSLLSDRTVRCWGANGVGQLGLGQANATAGIATPMGLGNVVSIAVGATHSCALRATGEVDCWGDNSLGQTGLGHTGSVLTPTRLTLSGVVEIAAAGDLTCARTYNEQVWCWGDGPVGDNTTTDRTSPVRIVGLDGAHELRFGGTRSSNAVGCGRTDAGWRCWGSATFGSVGLGTFAGANQPTPFVAVADAELLAMGNLGSCATDSMGDTFCWGSPGEGRIGTNIERTSTALAGVLVPLNVTPTEMVCRGATCCARDATRLQCWGDVFNNLNRGDSLRDGTSATRTALPVSTTALSLGTQHSCSIDSGGLHCWGTDVAGQLGVGDNLDRYEPVSVGIPNAASVSVNHDRSCARTSTGVVSCWGRGPAGNSAQTSNSNVPVVVDASSMGAASAIATGEFFSCALDALGAAWCWGDGATGTCGNGSASCPTPSPVGGGHTFVDLAAGQQHACGRTPSGSVYCWGSRVDGRLGDAGLATGFASTPVQVAGLNGSGLLSDAAAMALGDQHTCVRLASGDVYCFGDANSGKLGHGSSTDSPFPVAVTGLTGTTHLVCGEDSCMTRLADGSWVGWGQNGARELLGPSGSVSTPRAIPFDVAMSSVAMGSNFAIGVAVGGVTYGWGGANSSRRRALAFPVINDVVLP